MIIIIKILFLVHYYIQYNYNEEQLYTKLVNNRNFDFTKTNKDDTDLPIELIILLYKLKDVKTLMPMINL